MGETFSIFRNRIKKLRANMDQVACHQVILALREHKIKPKDIYIIRDVINERNRVAHPFFVHSFDANPNLKKAASNGTLLNTAEATRVYLGIKRVLRQLDHTDGQPFGDS
jgi:hypothetical protein